MTESKYVIRFPTGEYLAPDIEGGTYYLTKDIFHSDLEPTKEQVVKNLFEAYRIGILPESLLSILHDFEVVKVTLTVENKVEEPKIRYGSSGYPIIENEEIKKAFKGYIKQDTKLGIPYKPTTTDVGFIFDTDNL